MEKKGIGPQGLGTKGHNGFWIGSPAKQKKDTKGTLSIDLNANKDKPSMQNKNPKGNANTRVSYDIGRTNFTGTANTQGSYSFGMGGRSKSGKTSYNLGFNSNKGGKSVSAGIKFKI